MDRFRVAGQSDVFGRWLVRVQPVGMRVVYAEEFEPPFAQFSYQAHDFLVRDRVIPGRIGRDVVRRERLRDYAVLPRQNSTAFPMRLATGMFQELPVHFAATSDGSLHFREYITRRIRESHGPAFTPVCFRIRLV